MNNKGFIEILAILLIIFVFTMIGYMIYKDINFGPKQGIVIDKRYNSSWVSYSTSHANSSTINFPIVHPESWSIKIKKNNKEIWIDIDQNEYKEIEIGDCYHCDRIVNNR